MTDYRQHPSRVYYEGLSGIYVRALSPDDRWVSCDILTLEDQSLRSFVGRDIDWAVSCAQMLAERLREGASYA